MILGAVQMDSGSGDENGSVLNQGLTPHVFFFFLASSLLNQFVSDYDNEYETLEY